MAAADQLRPARAFRADLLRVHLVLVAGVVGEEDALADVALGELEHERGAAQCDGEDRQREREPGHAAKLSSGADGG
jgi:hypothetical protein